jgi:hypothetical protein
MQYKVYGAILMNDSITTNSTSSRQVQKHRIIHSKPHYIDIKTLFDFVVFNHFAVKGANTIKVLYFIANKLPNSGSNKDIGGCIWYSQDTIAEEIGIKVQRVSEVIRGLIQKNILEERVRGKRRYRAFTFDAILALKKYQRQKNRGELVEFPPTENVTEANFTPTETVNDTQRKPCLTPTENVTNHNSENNIENNISILGEGNLPPVDKKNKPMSKITKTSLIGTYRGFFKYCSREEADAVISHALRLDFSPQVILQALDELRPPEIVEKPRTDAYRIVEARCSLISKEE